MSKYKNVPTVIDNVRFASKKEARRYQELKLLLAANKISGLECDKKKLRWPLEVNGQLICTYEADFSYWAHIYGERLESRGSIIEVKRTEDVVRVIEDAKGFKTPAYKIKRKLMKAIHGIEIQEI